MKFSVSGVVNAMEQIEAPDAEHAIAQFIKKHPGADRVVVGLKAVIGFCADCERPIFDTDKWTPRREQMVCSKCLPR